jgi:heat shock protein HtpX
MWINKLKTVLLLSTLSGLLLLFGSLFGGRSGLQFALIIATIMNFIAYFYSEKIVLKVHKAERLDKKKYNWIYDIINELSNSMNIPTPKIWIIPSCVANAFATGRNPHNASVALTTGIIDLLDKRELRGVLAHELAHIKNYDTLIATIAATMAAAIGYLAHMFQYSLFWGSIGNKRRNNGNTIAMLFAALLMPLAATLIQLAISRSREYLADELGSRISGDPRALASALEKLHENIHHEHFSNDDTQRASTASLFIVHPFTNGGWIKLFSTHPPLEKRILYLEELYKKMF